MTWVLGETVSESFSIPSLATGQAFTRTASYINGSSTVWNPTFSEIGSGIYRYSYAVSSSGTAGSYEWSGTATNGDVVTINFDVESTGVTVSVAAASSGAQTTTLAELRQEVADRFEDLVQLTATANGNVGKTTLIDTYHINDGTEHFNGRDLLCTSGTNNGLRRRVTGTAKTTGTLTLNSALTIATATNDTFEVYNNAGRGFTIEQYDRAINYAIRDAYPTGKIKVVASIVAAFSALTPEITIPAAVTEVTSLEAQGADGDWVVVPPARSAGGDGWFADPALGQLRLSGQRAWGVDTLSLRVFGFGRQAELTSDSDTCALSPKFIVAAACYKLALGGARKPDNDIRINLFRDEMERYRVTLIQYSDAVRKKVRAA